jgi:hypothetical protein
MSKRRVLFIPDRFADHRMWASISDRLPDAVDVVHLDQLCQLPWAAGDAAIVGIARTVLPADGCDVAAAAGQASPLAVALAGAGLARSLVLFGPEIPFDRVPEDVDLTLDLPDADILAPYELLVGAMDDADPQQWRALLTDVVRQTAPAGATAAEVELAAAIARDHAAELRAELLAFAAASAAERPLPAELEVARLEARGQWLDRLATLSVPVVTVVPARIRFVADTVGRFGQRHDIVLTDNRDPLAPGGSRHEARAAIERLLDRVSGQDGANAAKQV